MRESRVSPPLLVAINEAQPLWRCCFAASLGLFAACESPSMPTPPSEPPTGIIYFEYAVPGIGDTAPWQVRPDGSDFARVPQPYPRVGTPNVGISGRWLAFEESGDIFAADLTNPLGLPDLFAYDITFVGTRSYPLVSPTGRFVANTYVGPDPDKHGIRISRNDQSGIETLLTPQGRAFGSDRAIGWFPDEDSLLIMEFKPQRLYSIVNIDGTGQHLLGITPAQFQVSVSLSPTGRFIAIGGSIDATLGDSASRTITIYELATGRLTRTIMVEEAVYNVIWSPDERFLAYTPIRGSGDQIDIAIIELSTGKRTVALDIPGRIIYPSWARDP